MLGGKRVFGIVSGAACILQAVLAQDDIGFGRGVVNFTTANFEISLIKESGTLASLRPTGSEFDFLPYDYLLLNRRVQNGSYHWGDINIRYRKGCHGNWTDSNSAARRTPITWIDTGAIASSDLSPTMEHGPLNITREWIDVDGDLGLQFTIENTGDENMELGSLGFPAAVNNIFTSRRSAEMYQKCSLMEPYIGLDAGHLRVTPLSGVGPALVVTPLGDTPLEAYRFLEEESRGGTRIESNGWEGYYEWQVHTKAWAKQEWKDVEPWNPPTTVVIRPGEKRTYGVRFTAVNEGIRHIDAAIRKLDIPTAIGVPGFIVPQDTVAQLFIQSSSDIDSIVIHPKGALIVEDKGNKTFSLRPSETAWGRVRVTITYESQKIQTVHYHITKSAPEAIADLGHFITTEHWFDDTSDPFGRAPSPLIYDYERKKVVDQDFRIWVAGLSDEGGASSYTVASVKQAFQPNAEEIAKLETFVDEVLYKTIQNEDYGVKRSVFFYDPNLVPGYNYSSEIDWTKNRGAEDKDFGYQVSRAYNYVWPAASYWALYRAARSYPELVKKHGWEWYLDQAVKTVLRGMQPGVGYNNKGLMGETVFGTILDDLLREGKSSQAKELEAAMKTRVDVWLTEEFPFGSEMAWDSTGQEGVYYWARHFGETTMGNKARNSIIGYMQTVPHWGYNGNARRYWDFVVTGKLEIIERQIHHYGSALNALPLLSSFRDDPSDPYLLRVGYGGTSAPLSNINQDGFAACAMHARPEHLSWDGFSGDYGPGFVGMVLGSGTYLAEDAEVGGLVVYGGNLEIEGDVARVQVRDVLRQKVFIAPLRLEVKVDAGMIESFTYNVKTRAVSLTLGQREGSPRAKAAVVWASKPGSGGARSSAVEVVGEDGAVLEDERLGKRVSLESGSINVWVNED